MFYVCGTWVTCLPPLKPICQSGRTTSEVNLLSERFRAKRWLKWTAHRGLFPQDCLLLMLHANICRGLYSWAAISSFPVFLHILHDRKDTHFVIWGGFVGICTFCGASTDRSPQVRESASQNIPVGKGTPFTLGEMQSKPQVSLPSLNSLLQ